jgi:hypothetical protein
MIKRAVVPAAHQGLNPMFDTLVSHKGKLLFQRELTFPSNQGLNHMFDTLVSHKSKLLFQRNILVLIMTVMICYR